MEPSTPTNSILLNPSPRPPQQPTTNNNDQNQPNYEDYTCAICLRLLFKPVTLRCGHSFCNSCCQTFYSSSSSSHKPTPAPINAKCPTCRDILPLARCSKTSLTLSKLLESVFPQEYEMRRLEMVQERNTKTPSPEAAAATAAVTETEQLPLFFLDPMLPRQEMVLNVFEPRYLHMVSRCLEDGSRRFGMVGFSSPYNLGIRSEQQQQQNMRYGVEVNIVETYQLTQRRIVVRIRAGRRFVVSALEEETTVMEEGFTVSMVQWLPLPVLSLAMVSEPSALLSTNRLVGHYGERNENSEDGAEPSTTNNNNNNNNNNTENPQQHEQTILEKSQSLNNLIQEWKKLVRNGGWQRHNKQIDQILRDIGPMPPVTPCLSCVIDRCLWVAALINPLPGLGVAEEIRPAMLEHAAAAATATTAQQKRDSVERCLDIVTESIQSSIEYVRPDPLYVWFWYYVSWLWLRLGDGENGELEEESQEEDEGNVRPDPPPPFPGMVPLLKAWMKFALLGFIVSLFWSSINGGVGIGGISGIGSVIGGIGSVIGDIGSRKNEL